MKPLLIGEVNPYGADPDYALYPHPRGAAGDRLRQHLGLTDNEYLELFDRTNLCTGSWNGGDAKETAATLLVDTPGRDVFVLLGQKVCKAFGFEFKPFTMVRVTRADVDLPMAVVAILPHPSGRSRLWNPAESRQQARDVLNAAGVKLPSDGCCQYQP